MRTRAGYAGGSLKDPTYHQLGDHSESLQVDFDPKAISFAELVDLFWASHDPTRGAWSTQYAAILFYESEEQRQIALDSRDRVAAGLGRAVQTEVRPLDRFYRAEDYHQKYRLRHVRDLMAEFRQMYPVDVDFVDSTAAARVNGYLDGYGTAAQLEAEVGDLGLPPALSGKLLDLVRNRGRRR